MELNLPGEKRPKVFSVREGSILKTMPRILRQGKVPLSPRALMIRRLQIANGTPVNQFDDLQKDWLNNYFYTGLGILRPSFYAPNPNRFKIVNSLDLLRRITPQATIKDGDLVLPNGTYEAVEGEEVERRFLQIKNDLTRQQVLDSPIWRALTRKPDGTDDLDLLADTFDLTREVTRRPLNMPIYLTDIKTTPILSLWCVTGPIFRSEVYCASSRVGGSGRLVAVTPETLRELENGTYAPRISLEINVETVLYDKERNSIVHRAGGYDVERVDQEAAQQSRQSTTPEIPKSKDLEYTISDEDKKRIERFGRFGAIELD